MRRSFDRELIEKQLELGKDKREIEIEFFFFFFWKQPFFFCLMILFLFFVFCFLESMDPLTQCLFEWTYRNSEIIVIKQCESRCKNSGLLMEMIEKGED